MSREDFILNKNSKGIRYGEFRNRIELEYKEILSESGIVVCDYIMILRMENTIDYYTGEVNSWEKPDHIHTTVCSKCFMVNEAIDWNGDYIKVNKSIDMLPLYMKWALKIKDVFPTSRYNNKDYIELSQDPIYKSERNFQVLDRLHWELNDPDKRLPNFTQYTCRSCRKEWIVFDSKKEQPN